MVTPLMMSFADQDGSESLIFRVGTGLHKGNARQIGMVHVTQICQ